MLGRSGRKITERRIRQMLQAGDLEGDRDEHGRWRIPRRVVNQLLAERREREQLRAEPESALEVPESVRALMDRVAALERERGRLEGRLELTEQTESTLREERDRLLKERVEAQEDARKLREELQQERSKGFWQRLFGG